MLRDAGAWAVLILALLTLAAWMTGDDDDTGGMA